MKAKKFPYKEFIHFYHEITGDLIRLNDECYKNGWFLGCNPYFFWMDGNGVDITLNHTLQIVDVTSSHLYKRELLNDLNLYQLFGALNKGTKNSVNFWY